MAVRSYEFHQVLLWSLTWIPVQTKRVINTYPGQWPRNSHCSSRTDRVWGLLTHPRQRRAVVKSVTHRDLSRTSWQNLYQYTDHSRPAQSAAGAPRFGRETVSCCARRHWKIECISVFSLQKFRDRKPKKFWRLTKLFVYTTFIHSFIPSFIHSFIHSFVFSLRGRAGRNQSPVMWPVWLWHNASWASSWG